MSKQNNFDAGSPAFTYSVIVALLSIFAAAGVQLPQDPAALATDITTSLNGSNYFALIGVLASSFILPLFNFFKAQGKSVGQKIWFGLTRSSTLVALLNALFAGLVLSGFTLPSGTSDQIVNAIVAKDWMGLISVWALTVGNTLIRYFRDRVKVEG